MGYAKEIVIRAPIAEVWSAWTSTEEATKWLAPGANVVFEVGEPYEFFWDDDPAVDSTLGCKLLEIERERRLVFEWQGKTEFLAMFQPPGGTRTKVAVDFAPTADGVRVRVVQAETREGDQWAAYDAWMAMAWQMALGALKGHCEREASRPFGAGEDGAGCCG